MTPRRRDVVKIQQALRGLQASDDEVRQISIHLARLREEIKDSKANTWRRIEEQLALSAAQPSDEASFSPDDIANGR